MYQKSWGFDVRIVLREPTSRTRLRETASVIPCKLLYSECWYATQFMNAGHYKRIKNLLNNNLHYSSGQWDWHKPPSKGIYRQGAFLWYVIYWIIVAGSNYSIQLELVLHKRGIPTTFILLQWRVDLKESTAEPDSRKGMGILKWYFGTKWKQTSTMHLTQ